MGLLDGDDDKNSNKALETHTDKSGKENNKRMIGEWWNHTTDLYSSLMQEQNANFNEMLNKKYDEAMGVTNEIIGHILDNLGVPGNMSNPYKIQNMLDDEFEQSDKKEINTQKTSSLYAFKSPNDKQYSTCLEANGTSVWDTNGFWRCLFSSEYISKHASSPSLSGKNELSIEDVENDKDHTLGVFFKDYTGYLSWRNQMLNLKREKDVETNRDVTGESSLVSYVKNDLGKEEIKESRVFYSNGTTKIIREKKFVPLDGSNAIESREEEMVPKETP